MIKTRVLVSAFVFSATACASQTGQAPDGTSQDAVVSSRASSDVITASELADPSLGDADALSIIKRLRPRFLATRGTASVNSPVTGMHVSIDGGPLVSASALTTIRAHEILEIRYLSPSAAAQAYGSGSGTAAVIVIRRR